MSSFLACKHLEQFATDLEGEVDEDAERWSVGEAAHVLSCLRQCRGALAIVEKRVEQLCIEAAGDRKLVQVDGLGAVEIKHDVRRNGWDNDALFRVVVARALDERQLDERTGEYEPAHEAVARVLAECARPSWRVTALRQRGIDDDEYCSKTFNGRKVLLP